MVYECRQKGVLGKPDTGGQVGSLSHLTSASESVLRAVWDQSETESSPDSAAEEEEITYLAVPKPADSRVVQIVYILDQVKALETELLKRADEQGLDIRPQIVVVTRYHGFKQLSPLASTDESAWLATIWRIMAYRAGQW